MARERRPSLDTDYGVVGIVAGVAFLVLNLNDPAHTDAGDWFWCVAGCVAGVLLVRHGLTGTRT